MLVLLDPTIPTNLALVGLASLPGDLWGNQASTTAEVLEEYAAGVETGKLPQVGWTQLKTITLSSEEQMLGIKMFPNLGRGERSCVALAVVRRAMLATDDQLARRAAQYHEIELIGIIGILKTCVQHRLLSQPDAQSRLEEMIVAGYYSPVLKLDFDQMKKGRSKAQLNTVPVLSAPRERITAKPLPQDRSPAAVYLAQLKQSSRRPQKQALDLIASLLSGGSADCSTLNWADVRYQNTAAVRSRLLDGYAPATANRILSALRGVLEQRWLLGQISAEDYRRAARLSPVIGETLPAGRELAQEEILALLQDCGKEHRAIGTRDAAVITIMLGAGLRGKK